MQTPSLPPAAARLVTVGEDAEGQRLDNFLLARLKGVPHSHVYRIVRSGEVRVNKGRAQADTRLRLGDVVRLPPVRVAEGSAVEPRSVDAATPPREFPVVHEDDDLLVIDKPAGVAVHGGSGVAFGVIEQLRRARPQAKFLELVHRLDKETSGLLVLAKRRSALTALQQQWRGAGVVKRYAALVDGRWAQPHTVVDVPLVKGVDARGERHVRPAREGEAAALRAISLVRRERVFEGHSLLTVTLKTGRTHQIRVHLAQAGHPIVGDERYGDFERNREIARGAGLAGQRFQRMFLHARELQLDHPRDGRRLQLEAALPPELTGLLARLPGAATADNPAP